MSRPASNGVTGNWGKPSGIKKRRADDDLGNEQRLAKRFDLLNLGKRERERVFLFDSANLLGRESEIQFYRAEWQAVRPCATSPTTGTATPHQWQLRERVDADR